MINVCTSSSVRTRTTDPVELEVSSSATRPLYRPLLWGLWDVLSFSLASSDTATWVSRPSMAESSLCFSSSQLMLAALPSHSACLVRRSCSCIRCLSVSSSMLRDDICCRRPSTWGTKDGDRQDDTKLDVGAEAIHRRYHRQDSIHYSVTVEIVE